MSVVWAFGLVVSWFILVGLSSWVKLWLSTSCLCPFPALFLCTPVWLFHLFIWVSESVIFPLSLSVLCPHLLCLSSCFTRARRLCPVILVCTLFCFALFVGLSFIASLFCPPFVSCILHFGFVDYCLPCQLHLCLSPLFATPCQTHQFLFWRVGYSHMQISLFLSSSYQIIRCTTL